jgi:hypothetical protein
MALDLTSFDAAMKDYYTDERVHNMVYKDRPFLAMLNKDENFVGRKKPIPIVYGNAQGRSATFSTARTNKSDVQVEAFEITRKHDYGVVSIDNETLLAADGDRGSFLDAVTAQTDSIIDSVTDSLNLALFGTGSGARGQVNAEPTEATTTVITLKNAADIRRIEKNMVLNIYSAETGGSQRSVDGTIVNLTVAAVDRDAGTFTINEDYTSSGTIAANDYIFVQGDRGNMLSGLRAWLPDSAPGSTAFFSVDRSTDTTRLGGIRYDGSAQPIEEALIDAAARAAREGAKPDVCLMHYDRWSDLEKALGSKVQYVDVKGPAEVGFRGILIHGPKGPIKVMADSACPSDRAFMLQMDTWKLCSLKGAPHILRQDGLTMLRETDADSAELRVGYYAQLACRAPGFNVNIKLA